MDKDRVEGAAKQVKGAIKGAAGKVTRDRVLEAEGKAEEVVGKVQGEVGKAKDAVRDAAGAVVDEAKSVLGQVNEEASVQLSQFADQAKDKVSEATDKVKGVAAGQKDLLAAQIGGVADAMERVATDLEANGGVSAQYARMIADNAEQLSTTIRDNDVDQIMAKAQSFGRQQPVAFLGAAALLGFAASRFLLASANRVGQPSNAASSSTDNAPLSSTYSGRM